MIEKARWMIVTLSGMPQMVVTNSNWTRPQEKVKNRTLGQLNCQRLVDLAVGTYLRGHVHMRSAKGGKKGVV